MSDDTVESIIGDAYEYVMKCDQKFDLVFMDVCYEVN